MNTVLNKVVCIKSAPLQVCHSLSLSALSIVFIRIDPSLILIWIIFSTFILIILSSILAIYCCCRARALKEKEKKLPIVFDEQYSLNELIKEVGSFQTCHPREQSTIPMDSTGKMTNQSSS